MLFSFRPWLRGTVSFRSYGTKMVKHVFLIRHGQGQHNVLFAKKMIKEALALRDPEINEEGKRQSTELGRQLRETLKRLI